MIKHVVCFRLTSADRIPQWQQGSKLLAEIETVENFCAAPLLKQDHYHCALYMEFADASALEFYQKHPVHQQYLTEVLPPILEDKLVVDLET